MSMLNGKNLAVLGCLAMDCLNLGMSEQKLSRSAYMYQRSPFQLTMEVSSVEVAVIILAFDFVIVFDLFDAKEAKFFVETDCSTIVCNNMKIDSPTVIVLFHHRNDFLYKSGS